MLKSISCGQLVNSTLSFEEGLNAVVGADDAHNSIGKSSVLMLIDFAFGGSDFPSKCDDVIRNVGDFKVGIEFKFEKTYSFIRDTANIDQVYRVEYQDYLTVQEYNTFLKSKYFLKDESASFRECVSGFFRIYQRNNYNVERPLDVSSKEKWDAIRKRTLKIFGKYGTIENLEKNKATEIKSKNDIDGAFNTGIIKKVTKTQVKKNERELVGVSAENQAIKNALALNFTDVKSIINLRNLSLKTEKDRLVDVQQELNTELVRINANLSGNVIRTSKSFKSVVEFFPDIDMDKLQNVERFHNGITKILKNQLQEGKALVLERIELLNIDLKKIDDELLKIATSKKESVYLIERLLELNQYENSLKNQNGFWMKQDETKKRLRDIKDNINDALVDSLNEMELLINNGMNLFIKKIYNDNPISPQISFLQGDYKFDHGDDRGTGKAFANMICFDLTFLSDTILPCLIHDSLLFKNMDIPAVEKLIATYSESKKQIFIAIDEKPKYSKETQNRIDTAMFLELSEDKVAFKVKWKKKSN